MHTRGYSAANRSRRVATFQELKSGLATRKEDSAVCFLLLFLAIVLTLLCRRCASFLHRSLALRFIQKSRGNFAHLKEARSRLHFSPRLRRTEPLRRTIVRTLPGKDYLLWVDGGEGGEGETLSQCTLPPRPKVMLEAER